MAAGLRRGAAFARHRKSLSMCHGAIVARERLQEELHLGVAVEAGRDVPDAFTTIQRVAPCITRGWAPAIGGVGRLLRGVVKDAEARGVCGRRLGAHGSQSRRRVFFGNGVARATCGCEGPPPLRRVPPGVCPVPRGRARRVRQCRSLERPDRRW